MFIMGSGEDGPLVDQAESLVSVPDVHQCFSFRTTPLASRISCSASRSWTWGVRRWRHQGASAIHSPLRESSHLDRSPDPALVSLLVQELEGLCRLLPADR